MNRLIKVGLMMLVGIFGMVIIYAAYIGWMVMVVEPIKQGYLPLYQMAESFGISELGNLIIFLVVLIPFILIFVGGSWGILKSRKDSES